MLNCHHNAHPCLDTRGGGSCEYFKAGSKTVGLMAGGLYSHDIHHSTNLAFVPTLLTNTILASSHTQKLKCKNMLHIYVLHSIICKNLFLSLFLFSKHLRNYFLIFGIQTKGHAQ